MKKKALIAVVLLLVSSLLLGACATGVSQEDYDAVVAERDAAQAQVASLQADLATSEGKLTTVQSELEEMQAEYQGFKSDLTSLWTSLDKKLELAAYIITFWAASSVGDEETVSQMILDMVIYVDAVGNAELSQMWDDAMSSAMQEQEAESMANFALLMIKTVELLGEDVEALEVMLAE